MSMPDYYNASLLAAPDLPLSVRIQEQPLHPAHGHEFTELVVVLAGSGTHLLDGERHELFPGAVFAVRPPSRHAYESSEGLNLANVLFEEAWVERRLPELAAAASYRALVQIEPAARVQNGIGARLALSPPELATARDTLTALRYELGRVSGDGDAEARTAAIARFAALLVDLCRAYRSSARPESRAVLGIARAVAFLEADPARRADPSALAALSRMSERSFHRQFRSFTGMSPGEYSLGLRLALAERLLATTRLTVTEIAFNAGFSDGNYFTRVFGRERGMAPREYRRSARPVAGRGS